MWPARAAAAMWALLPGDEARREEVAQRLVRHLPEGRSGAVWLHGASVGEARIVGSLAARLAAGDPPPPLVVSATTRTGRSQLPRDGIEDAFFLPLDFPGLPGKLIDALRPACLVLVETELWPNLLSESLARGLPVGVVNGRLAPEKMSRYRRFASLYRPLLGGLRFVGAASTADADRFHELGVPASVVTVTGNIKYDLPVPRVDAGALRRELAIDDQRPVLVAGSTGIGEEPQILDAFAAVRERYPTALLVLAPRHVERAAEVAGICRDRGLRCCTRSSGQAVGDADLLLVDTLGELGRLYALGHAAFVGGSLVPVGGHNLLEPLVVGTPVQFGPHTMHFEQLAATLIEAGAGCRIADSARLAEEWLAILDDPARGEEQLRAARACIEREQGALERSVQLVRAAILSARVH
ncbi:hypothetical protein ABI59_01755 [Acidobacteria bacterium Mor1]|nr:hypothetical protein ABI59_01755 [Acidobacteria bacterium Mor1]